MIRNSLNRQGYGLSGSWSRTPSSLPDLSKLSSMPSRVSPAEDVASAPAAEKVQGVDYGTYGEGVAQPGASLRAARDPFEQQAADRLMGSIKSIGMGMPAKAATSGIMASALGAPAAVASKIGVQSMMPGVASLVGLASTGISQGIAQHRARGAYGPVSASMDLYSDYMDETNPRTYTRDEVQQMDATKFGLEQQDRIARNPVSAIFGDLPAYDPLTRGFVLGPDDPYGGGGQVDDGSYSGEGRTSRGLRGEYAGSEDFGMGTIGNMDAPAGGYDGGYGGGGGSDSGDSGDSGGGRAGNAGTSDASGGMGGYHKGGMIDNRNGTPGEEVMSRTLEGEYVFNRPTTEFLMRTMGKRKMDQLNRMGLSGRLG